MNNVRSDIYKQLLGYEAHAMGNMALLFRVFNIEYIKEDYLNPIKDDLNKIFE